MPDYAISHAPIGTAFVIKADQFRANMPLPEILRLTKDGEKEAAFSAFTPDDTVYIEMGGATDQLALLALASGAQVSSIPSFMLGDKDAVMSSLETSGWTLKDEKPRGGETGDKLTARRNRALLLAACAAANDERLVPFREDEWQILRVKMLYRSFRQVQKAFLIAFQQLCARLRLDYMLAAAAVAMNDTSDDKPARKSKAVTAQQSLDVLLQTFSEAERAKFLEKIGIEDASLRMSIPRERLESLYEELTDQLMETDVTVSTVVTSMKETKKQLEAVLDKMVPYKKVFKPIPGCGPLIAARIIANIGDIRRFPPRSTRNEKFQARRDERLALGKTCEFEKWKQDPEANRRIDKTTNVAGQPLRLRGPLHAEQRVAQIIGGVMRERGEEALALIVDQIVASYEHEIASRRLEDAAKLKAFAGYHHRPDRSRACRKAGEVSNWAPELKQAIYLLCDQTLKRKDSPWRKKLDCRRAFELYKLLVDRQRKANEQGIEVEILPAAYASRKITSMLDMTVADLAVHEDTGKRTKPTKQHPEGKPILKLVGGLAFHVDQLRAQAGIKSVGNDEEETADAENEIEASTEIKNPELAKLVKGLKKVALDKAMRWLGQKFLEHIFREWHAAIGLAGRSNAEAEAQT